MQLNPRPVGISLRSEVETAPTEIPHAADLLEMPAFRIGWLDVNQPIDLDARLATPVEPVPGSLIFLHGKHSLLKLIHDDTPRPPALAFDQSRSLLLIARPEATEYE